MKVNPETWLIRSKNETHHHPVQQELLINSNPKILVKFSGLYTLTSTFIGR